jgi:hypothetical protein
LAPAAPFPVPPAVVEIGEVVVAARAAVDELFEEPPQAASPRQASRKASVMALAAGRGLLLWM